MKRAAIRFICTFLLSVLPVSISLAGAPWRFVVTGDSRDRNNGANTTILSEIAAEIVGQNADFALFSGDLVDGDPRILESQLAAWRDTMQPVYNEGIGVYVCRGNHDGGSAQPWNDGVVNAWKNVFGDLPDNGPAGEAHMTYSVTHKNAFVVALDQYVPAHQHRINQTWLDAQLAANTNPHVFAFGHEPAFSVGHDDCLDDYPADRDAFWTAIAGAGGRTYFCGHDHYYNHARVDNGDGDPDNDVHQYVVGTSGAPLYDWDGAYDGNNSSYTPVNLCHVKKNGYVVVEIDGLDVTLTWMERIAAGEYSAADVWTYTAVPEPATLSLLVVGAAALIRRRETPRRRQHLMTVGTWKEKHDEANDLALVASGNYRAGRLG